MRETGAVPLPSATRSSRLGGGGFGERALSIRSDSVKGSAAGIGAAIRSCSDRDDAVATVDDVDVRGPEGICPTVLLPLMFIL